MPGIPWYLGSTDSYAEAARAQRKAAAGADIAGAVGGLARLANQERLRREKEEQETAQLEAELGAQEGKAEAQTESPGETSSAGAPPIDQPEAPGSTTETGESGVHRFGRTLLSPFGLMNRTPPGVERPEIALARLRGRAAARGNAIRVLGALQGATARAEDVGAVIQRAGVPGFGPGTIKTRPAAPAKRTAYDLIYEMATDPNLTPQEKAQLTALLRVVKPPAGQGSPGKPSAAMQEEAAVSGRLLTRLGREPTDYELGLVLNFRHGKLDPDLNADEYQKAARLSGMVDEASAGEGPAGSTAPPRSAPLVATDPKTGQSIQLSR